jgi:3'-phosphoadenosine 5'-phosphosulfate sulfotransferase (PAPS reductase)/FAD synthetase
MSLNKNKVLVLIPLSGGKDSQAAMLWAIERYGLESCETAFCDVKWEAEETYKHIEYLVSKSGVKHNVLVSKKYDGMVDLAVKKGRFPSSTARFCTEELKVKPMIDFILTKKNHIIVIDGVRADESEKRSKQKPECRYFKYYFEPHTTNSLIVEKYAKKPPVTHKQKEQLKKATDRLALGKEDAKFFTYRKKEVFEWCSKFADDLIRPFFYNSGDDVIYYSLNRGYNINPLYFQGFSRVGCEPCIMGNQQEIKEIVAYKPHVIEKIKQAEQAANSSFFPPDKAPKNYHSKTAPNGKTYPTIEDVVRYIQEKNATGNLFENDIYFNKCKSFYNICE